MVKLQAMQRRITVRTAETRRPDDILVIFDSVPAPGWSGSTVPKLLEPADPRAEHGSFGLRAARNLPRQEDLPALPAVNAPGRPCSRLCRSDQQALRKFFEQASMLARRHDIDSAVPIAAPGWLAPFLRRFHFCPSGIVAMLP